MKPCLTIVRSKVDPAAPSKLGFFMGPLPHMFIEYFADAFVRWRNPHACEFVWIVLAEPTEAFRLVKASGSGLPIGPLLIGQSRSAQIVPMGASVAELVQSAALAAHEALAGHG